MQEYRFRRRKGFDAAKTWLSLYRPEDEGLEVSRCVASRHWGCRAQPAQELHRAASEVRHAAFKHASGQGELQRNNVVNVAFSWIAQRARTAGLSRHLRPVLERFGARPFEHREPVWLVCHEVEHHVDEGLAEDAAFCVWYVAGPPKAMEFANMGFGVELRPGDALLFDGMQPHAVRVANRAAVPFAKESCAEDDLPQTAEGLSVFYSIDVALDEPVCRRMGITLSTSRKAHLLDFTVDAATGRATIRRV